MKMAAVAFINGLFSSNWRNKTSIYIFPVTEVFGISYIFTIWQAQRLGYVLAAILDKFKMATMTVLYTVYIEVLCNTYWIHV